MNDSNKKSTKPERVWKHDGLECHVMKCIFNSGSYHRCGYVTVPKNHVCYGVEYDDIPVEVHGGLTYSSFSKDKSKYTVGFDCAHWGDVRSDELAKEGHFWTLDDVIKETNKLAEEINKVTVEGLVKAKLEYMPDWFKENITYDKQ